jgi:hypothetical protein
MCSEFDGLALITSRSQAPRTRVASGASCDNSGRSAPPTGNSRRAIKRQLGQARPRSAAPGRYRSLQQFSYAERPVVRAPGSRLVFQSGHAGGLEASSAALAPPIGIPGKPALPALQTHFVLNHDIPCTPLTPDSCPYKCIVRTRCPGDPPPGGACPTSLFRRLSCKASRAGSRAPAMGGRTAPRGNRLDIGLSPRAACCWGSRRPWSRRPAWRAPGRRRNSGYRRPVRRRARTQAARPPRTPRCSRRCSPPRPIRPSTRARSRRSRSARASTPSR